LKRIHLNVAIFTLTRTVLNTMHRMVYPFLGTFRDGLGVNLQVLSLVLTVKSLVGALSPFLATIADNHGRKTGMLIGVCTFTLGAGVVILSPTFPAFVTAIMLTVLGKYLFDPSMHAYFGDQIVYKERGRVMAISEFSWSLSFILGIPAVGILIARYGWSGPFPTFTVLGIILTAVIAFIIPNDHLAPKPKLPVWGNLGAILSYKPALYGLAMSAMFSMANEVFNLVFGLWLEDNFGLKIAALGAASALIGISELGGESLVATLVDRIGKLRSVALGLIANSVLALILPLIARNLSGALIGLFLFYFTFEFTIVSSIPLMSEIVPAARATMISSMAAAHSVGRAIGALISAPLYATGIYANTSAAALFNLLSLAALFWLAKIEGERL
jgi:DHA1 family inner membrane transport protein